MKEEGKIGVTALKYRDRVKTTPGNTYCKKCKKNVGLYQIALINEVRKINIKNNKTIDSVEQTVWKSNNYYCIQCDGPVGSALNNVVNKGENK